MKGRIVAIGGIDGCGKSTIAKELISIITENGKRVHYVWMRYNHFFAKPLLVFCRLIGLTWYEPTDSRVGYHDFYRSATVSWLYIFLTFVDTLLASVVRVYVPAFVFGRTVICDRWILDILVDLATDTRKDLDCRSFWVRSFLALIPSRAKCFVVYRDEIEIMNVRSEHRLDKNYCFRKNRFDDLKRFSVATGVCNIWTVGRAAREINKHL
jgi:energy-coupling factor transporter ATP-binding protein EcfA2